MTGETTADAGGDDAGAGAVGTATDGADGNDGLVRRDFGFTWGETGDTLWLRNDGGDYKRIDPRLLDPLTELARGERDPGSVDPRMLRAIDLLAEEGYLEPGGDVRRYETPADIRLWPRLAAFAVLALAAGALIAARWEAVWQPPGSIAVTTVLVPFFLGATLIHELGHWAASRPYFSADVRFGRLNGVIPAVITRTNDAWRCPRNVRIWISLAGPFVDVVITLALAVAYALAPDRGALGTLILVQLFRLGFVLNPLVDGDGYWLLVDAFGLHNLRSRAFEDLRRGRPTGPAAFGLGIVAFTGAFVLASAYFLAQLAGLGLEPP